METEQRSDKNIDPKPHFKESVFCAYVTGTHVLTQSYITGWYNVTRLHKHTGSPKPSLLVCAILAKTHVQCIRFRW